MNKAIIVCPNCGKSNRVPAAAEGKPRCGNCHYWLPWIVEAGDEDFRQVAEESSIPVLVDFWAAWCGPCRVVSPVLDQLARERAGNLKWCGSTWTMHPSCLPASAFRRSQP